MMQWQLDSCYNFIFSDTRWSRWGRDSAGTETQSSPSSSRPFNQQVFITCSNRSVGVYGSRVVCLVTTSRGTLPEDNDKGSIFHRWQDSHWGQETKTHHSHIYCCLNYSTASWKHKRLFWLLFFSPFGLNTKIFEIKSKSLFIYSLFGVFFHHQTPLEFPN